MFQWSRLKTNGHILNSITYKYNGKLYSTQGIFWIIDMIIDNKCPANYGASCAGDKGGDLNVVSGQALFLL